MYKVVTLKREHDLNKVLKSQKRTKHNIKILFYSLWDKWSVILVNKIKEAYGSNTTGQPLYLVNSFSLPHSFVIFKSTQVPHLVSLNRDKVRSVDYLPLVYKDLKL